jgi:ATP-dependent DNA helicase RecG
LRQAPAAVARKLEALGLRTAQDLAVHLPLRYEDETQLFDPAAAPPGKPGLVQARLERAEVAFRPRR